MYYYPRLENIKDAAETLKGVSVVTPLQFNERLSNRFSAQIFLKREDLQTVRSYKIRGAFNKMNSLSPKERLNGVVCASAGNHAQGVALSCSIMNVMGTIFMPVPTPQQKIEQVKMFGGEFVQIVLVGDTFDDASAAAHNHQQSTKATLIHPFDDEKVIEGQATVGLEIFEESKDVFDYIFVPVGGGGLSAGLGSVFYQLSPSTKVIGVEPKGAASLQVSMKNCKNTTLSEIDVFVDGASVKRIGERNFPICKKVINTVLTVDEGKVCQTILELYNYNAIVVEPAGALAISALDQYSDLIKGKRVACVVSGGNNDIMRMEEIKERTLQYQGLKHYFMVKFPQRPGALKLFINEVLGAKEDITYFEYTKKHERNVGPAIVGIQLMDKSDFEPLVRRMKQYGFFEQYLNDQPHLLNLII